MMRTQQTAFTLLELLVVMVLAAILTSFAIPNMRHLLLSHRITTKTNGFIATINYARNEAITRNNSTILIQPRIINEDGQLAWPGIGIPPSDNNWGNGWRIWVDVNKNNSADSETDIIKIFDFKNDQIILNAEQGSSYIHYIRQGRVRLPPNTNELSFLVCHEDYAQGKQVTILPTGRARTTSCNLKAQGNAYLCPGPCE